MDEQQQVQRIPRAIKKEMKYKKVKLAQQAKRKKLQQKLKQKFKELSKKQKDEYYEKLKVGKERMMKALEEGITVYVDMEYDVLMDDREIRSLAQQLTHIIGGNKELEHPIQLHLSNYVGQQKEQLLKQGSESWLVHKHEEGIEDIINENKENKEFIYLSPDADDELEDVEPDKCIYIIGGFVDRQVQKYISYNKANVLQICSKRLPINQYIKGNRRPLNIDVVASILSEYYNCKDWKKAYLNATSRNESLIQRMLKGDC